MEKMVIVVNGNKKYSDYFISLIKEGNCDKIRSLIKNVVASDIVDETGTTLLHLSTKHDSLDITKLLIDHGCNVDSKDNMKISPLEIAFHKKHFEVVKLLLDSGASISKISWFNQDVKHTIINSSEDVRKSCIQWFVKKLKGNSGGNAEKIVRKLINYKFLLTDIIFIRDANLTKIFLKNKNSNSISDSEFKNSLYLVVNLLDFENAKVLLAHGLTFCRRYKGFFDYFMSLISKISKENSKFYKKIIAWDILGEDYIHIVGKMLENSKIDILKTFFECSYYSEVKNLCNLDLMANVFGNRNDNVIKFLEEKQIDVNARSYMNQTALHFAVKNAAAINLRFLLDRGADLNAINDNEKTPLFVSLVSKRLSNKNRNCLDLLLQYGANVLEPCGPNKESFVEYSIRKTINEKMILYDSPIAEVATTQVLIGKELEFPVKPTYVPYLDGELRKLYNTFLCQLDMLKSHEIRRLSHYESQAFLSCDRKFTMFTIILEKPENIFKFVKLRDKEIIRIYIQNYRKEKTLSSY